MSRRATQLALVLSLLIWPAISFARAPQVTQASAAAAEANAQAVASQASALQATSQQTAAQVTTAQNALRDAMQTYIKAPAGAPKTAAQAAVQQAQKQLIAAQTAARAAAVQAITARSAAARAAAQAASAQAALARQAAAAPAAQPAVQPATTPTAAAVTHAGPGTSTAASSGASGSNSTLGTVLNSVFGGNSGGGANGSKATKNGTAGAANNGAENAGQTGATQGNALIGSNNGAGRGGVQSSGTAEQQNAPAGPTRKVGAAFANGALGVGQSTDTLLTVYGCSRMGTQVMCDTDLSNQNNSVNQVNSADQWKDVYLQDDAGDNHMRSMGVFENQNGDQRTSITLPYGEKSRYILVFNGVPANVKSVTLKSSKDTLDVEGIAVSGPDAPADAQGAAPNQAAPAGMQPASAPAGRTGSRPPHS